MNRVFCVFAAVAGVVASACAAPDAAKIAAVKEGKITCARASWWGFDPADSTKTLQAALDSGAKQLVIDRQKSPYVAEPLHVRAGMEIIFEEGAEIVAKKGSFKDRFDCLLNIVNADNVTIRGLGSGGIIRMHKKDYLDGKQYQRGEWRHAVNVKNSNKFLIEKMNIYSSGGDGVYLCLVNDAVVRNVLCDDHNRQGCSIIGGKNILIEKSVFSNTRGTSPQSGLDIEPNNTSEPLQGIVVRDCRFAGNFRWGILIAATRANSDLAGEMDIKFENCIAENNREGDIYAYTRTEFKSGDPIRGKIIFDNCQAISTRKDPFVRPPVEVDLDLHHQLQVIFKNLTVQRGENASKAVQINFNHPLSAGISPQGKVIFDNLKLLDTDITEAFQINDYSFSGKSDFLSGSVTDCYNKKFDITSKIVPVIGIKAQPEYPMAALGNDVAVSGSGNGAIEMYPEFPFILSADYWLYAEAGQLVSFTLKYIKNGRWSRDPAKVTLIAPDGKRTELGSVAPAREEVFTFTAGSKGIYRAEVRGFYLKTALTASNVPAGPVAKDFENELDRVTGSVYFYVAPGTPAFAVRVWGRGFVNSVGVEITDPAGKTVYRNPTVCGSGVQFNATAAQAASGGIWKLTFKRPRKYWYDRCFFRLMGTSPFLGLRADRIVVAK